MVTLRTRSISLQWNINIPVIINTYHMYLPGWDGDLNNAEHNNGPFLEVLYQLYIQIYFLS